MKLSLIIPCFNEAKSLPKLVKRCKELTEIYENSEVILVDNGSLDDTEDTLKCLLLNCEHVSYISLTGNKGYGGGIIEGLKAAQGEILCWTHADLQTDVLDILHGVKFFKQAKFPERVFVKGRRFGRPFPDTLFTWGMSIFETILFKQYFWDINAQPTMFHAEFFKSWEDPPIDFSLDLYTYYQALCQGLTIKRFPVEFSKRQYGVSNWNIDLKSKLRFIKRTVVYSLGLRKRL